MAHIWQILGEKMLQYQQSLLSKWQRDIILAEIISKITGEVGDHCDEESS